MSTIITSDNGVEISVGLLALDVTDPVSAIGVYARLSDAQRVELAAALDPGRRGLHVRLDNQAATLATYRRECDEALRKKGEMVDRAVRAERERDAAVARADQLRDERDDAVQSCIAVGRERDEWKARAEQAEQELKPSSSLRQQADSWMRIVNHPAISQALSEKNKSYSDQVFERITWLAETSEAVTELQPAPVVDRDVVEAELVNGLHRGFTAEQLARRVCAAIDSDPAVHGTPRTVLDMSLRELVQTVVSEARNVG